MFAKKTAAIKMRMRMNNPIFLFEIEIETKKKNLIQLEHGSNFILMTKR
jgi:hypothetical protein